MKEFNKISSQSFDQTQSAKSVVQTDESISAMDWIESPAPPSQQGYFFTQQLFKDYQPLNTGLSIKLEGPLNQEALEESLNSLVKRHTQLRTSFHHASSGIVSRCHLKNYNQALEKHDLRNLTEEEQLEKVKELENSEIRYPFNLAQPSLLRTTLITLSASESILIIVNHHITGDGTSLFQLFLGELSTLYKAFCEGGNDPIPSSDVSFQDFIKTQNAENSGKTLEKRLKFWDKKLQNAPAYTEMPSDKRRPQSPTGSGGRIEGPLYPDLTGQVSEFAGKIGVNNVSVYLGAFYALLFHYSNQNDLVIGLPLSNRQPEFKDIYGPLLNTIPIRANISQEMTFKDLVIQIQETSFLSILRGNVPIETIIANSRYSNDRSHSPIYQIVFNYMTFSPQTFQLHALDTQVKRLFPDSVWLDLVVEAEEKPDGFCMSMNYNTDIFDHDFISRLIGSYQTLLSAGLKSPDTSIPILPALTTEQIIELTDQRNNTWREYPKAFTIHGAFEEQVKLTPDAIAVCCNGVSLSYSELNNRANNLANSLRAMDIGRNDIVGLCMSRQSDMLTGLLGILKSGAAYLPLDPLYPEDRLNFMIDDSNASIVLTTSDLGHIFHGSNSQFVNLDKFDFTSGNDTQPNLVNHSTDLAYMIYTSGSTGKPKGVLVKHQNISNFFTAMDEVLDFSPGDTGTWVSVTSISFDISILEIFWSLSRSFTVILQSDELNTSNSPASLILEHNATHFQCTPSQARMLLAEKNIKTALNKIDKMLVGGEALPLDVATQLFNMVGGQLINVYGPTETTIWSTSHRVVKKDLELQIIPIGRPIANTALYVLDKNLNTVPQGAIGELFIGGEGVALGYLNRDDLTNTRFIPDPFRPENSRMYRTGDLVRYREDGTLQFIGRNDHQVKLRGYRIEMGEVENHLLKLKGVSEAVAIVREDVQGDQKLIAYIVANDAFEETQAKSELTQTIPSYMVPNLFITLEKLPLTANGKIDRKALPKQTELLHSPQKKALLAPRNDTEIRLSILWKELLQIDNIDVRDSFFDLGGHSLLSLRLAKLIEEEFQTTYEPIKVFMSPSIEDQANALIDSHSSANRAIITLQKKGDGAPIYCLCGIHLYEDLAKLMGEDQPFLAIYVPEEIAFLSHTSRHGTIKDLARSYYDLILENHDGTPLRLLGFCFGGALAFEVALLAEADGIEVDHLILLDSVIWSHLKRRNMVRIGRFFRKLITRGPGIFIKQFRSIREKALERSTKSLNNEELILILQNHMAYYKPNGQIRANTIMFNSNDPNIFDTWKVTSLLGWENYLTGEAMTINSVGNHIGLLQKPMIKQVANQLKSLLYK